MIRLWNVFSHIEFVVVVISDHTREDTLRSGHGWTVRTNEACEVCINSNLGDIFVAKNT